MFSLSGLASALGAGGAEDDDHASDARSASSGNRSPRGAPPQGPSLTDGLWGMAASLGASVRATTSELASTFQETRWADEFAELGRGLREEAGEAQGAVERLPTQLGHAMENLPEHVDRNLHELQRRAAEFGDGLHDRASLLQTTLHRDLDAVSERLPASVRDNLAAARERALGLAADARATLGRAVAEGERRQAGGGWADGWAGWDDPQGDAPGGQSTEKSKRRPGSRAGLARGSRSASSRSLSGQGHPGKDARGDGRPGSPSGDSAPASSAPAGPTSPSSQPPQPPPRHAVELAALRRSPATFTEPPASSGYGPWRETFSLSARVREAEAARAASSALAARERAMVPAQITEEEFWARYFWRLERLEGRRQAKDRAARSVRAVAPGARAVSPNPAADGPAAAATSAAIPAASAAASAAGAVGGEEDPWGWGALDKADENGAASGTATSAEGPDSQSTGAEEEAKDEMAEGETAEAEAEAAGEEVAPEAADEAAAEPGVPASSPPPESESSLAPAVPAAGGCPAEEASTASAEGTTEALAPVAATSALPPALPLRSDSGSPTVVRSEADGSRSWSLVDTPATASSPTGSSEPVAPLGGAEGGEPSPGETRADRAGSAEEPAENEPEAAAAAEEVDGEESDDVFGEGSGDEGAEGDEAGADWDDDWAA